MDSGTDPTERARPGGEKREHQSSHTRGDPQQTFGFSRFESEISQGRGIRGHYCTENRGSSGHQICTALTYL